MSEWHEGIGVVLQLNTKELASSASRWKLRHLIAYTYRLLARGVDHPETLATLTPNLRGPGKQIPAKEHKARCPPLK